MTAPATPQADRTLKALRALAQPRPLGSDYKLLRVAAAAGCARARSGRHDSPATHQADRTLKALRALAQPRPLGSGYSRL